MVTRMKFIEKKTALSEIADCTFGPHNEFVTKVSPGEEATVETYDCLANAVKLGRDITEVLRSGTKLSDNPITGPIYIEGAEKRGTLDVDIVGIKIPDIGLTAETQRNQNQMLRITRKR